MEKDEVIAAFCKLAYKVNSEVFHFHVAADCFCKERAKERAMLDRLGLGFGYHFSPDVLDFIRAAVAEKIARTQHGARKG